MRTVRDALKDFGHRVGIPNLALNKNGVCEISADGGLEMYFAGDPDGRIVQMSGLVGVLQDGGPALAQMLLNANFGGYRTGGAAFALDPLTDEIVLTKSVAVDRLQLDEFIAEIEEFAGIVTSWSERLPRLAVDGPAAGPAPSDDDSSMTFRL